MSNENERTLNDLMTGKPFKIPTYQRGYRWQQINVIDLLNDLWDFMHDDKPSYSMQPLVVKDMNSYWNVVDGQQRLTTFYILRNFLEDRTDNIECQSRPNQKLVRMEGDANIDQYHINKAYDAISEWFNDDNGKKEDFIRLLHDEYDTPIKKKSEIYLVSYTR